MWALNVLKSWRHVNKHNYLAEISIGRRPATSLVYVVKLVAMFKITHNTVHRFSLSEILLMLVLNEVEARREVDSNVRARCKTN